MAYVPTVQFALLARLVDVLTQALPNVTVADGDIYRDEAGAILVVGWDDPENERAVSVDARQSWAGATNRQRDETGTISCFLIVQDGDGNLREAREQVASIVSTVALTLRADPNLGGLVPGLHQVEFGTATSLNQFLTAENGALVRLSFDLSFTARI